MGGAYRDIKIPVDEGGPRRVYIIGVRDVFLKVVLLSHTQLICVVS